MSTTYKFKLLNTKISDQHITFQLERFNRNRFLLATTERVNISAEITVNALEVMDVDILCERILRPPLVSPYGVQTYPDFRFTTTTKTAVII